MDGIFEKFEFSNFIYSKKSFKEVESTLILRELKISQIKKIKMLIPII